MAAILYLFPLDTSFGHIRCFLSISLMFRAYFEKLDATSAENGFFAAGNATTSGEIHRFQLISTKKIAQKKRCRTEKANLQRDSRSRTKCTTSGELNSLCAFFQTIKNEATVRTYNSPTICNIVFLKLFQFYSCASAF